MIIHTIHSGVSQLLFFHQVLSSTVSTESMTILVEEGSPLHHLHYLRHGTCAKRSRDHDISQGTLICYSAQLLHAILPPQVQHNTLATWSLNFALCDRQNEIRHLRRVSSRNLYKFQSSAQNFCNNHIFWVLSGYSNRFFAPDIKVISHTLNTYTIITYNLISFFSILMQHYVACLDNNPAAQKGERPSGMRWLCILEQSYYV